MAISLVPSVEVNHIAGENASHAFGKRLMLCPHQQMKMVLHERPGIDRKEAFLA